MASRRRLAPTQRRQQLIELGLDMLSRRQLAELSVEEIAAQAGISRGLLFHYFDSKTDFHRAVVAAAAQRLVEVTEPDPSLPPMAQLRTSMEAFVDYITTNKAGYLSLVRGAASGDDVLRAIFDRTRQRLAARIVDKHELLGLEDSPRLALAVRGWLAYVEEISVVWLNEPDEVSRAELLELADRAFLTLIGL